MKKKNAIKWLAEPTDKDYPAAESFLQLLYDAKTARAFTKKLRRADMAQFAAKDLLRASGTRIAQIQAYDWVTQHNEIEQGTPLSPLLLVRGKRPRKLIVVDGFHRLCAVFAVDQDMVVPCKIV